MLKVLPPTLNFVERGKGGKGMERDGKSQSTSHEYDSAAYNRTIISNNISNKLTKKSGKIRNPGRNPGFLTENV